MGDKLTNESHTSGQSVELREGASGLLPGVRNGASSGAKTVTVPTPRPRRVGVRTPPVAKVCEQCGTDYLVRYDQAAKSRFCSAKCRCQYAAKVRNSVDQNGANNPNWKGGISEDRVRYTRIQMERYPERDAARRLARMAIASGKLVRQPCEKCGTTEDVQAHHDDYSKPLEVRWLCRPDHRAHHEAERREKAA